jgi:hypothetical protein
VGIESGLGVQFWIQKFSIVHKVLMLILNHRFLSILMSVFHIPSILLSMLSSL